jgi:hypothetical protein
MIVVTTAIPHLVKKSKPLAKCVGEKFVEFGNWMLEDEPEAPAEATQEAPSSAARSKPKTARARPAAKKPAPKTTQPKKSNSDEPDA